MYRKELPRIYELIDLTEDPSTQSAYFFDFDNSIRFNPIKKEVLLNREKEFQGLDAISWETLKNNARNYLMRPDPKWFVWHQLNEIFNEARGYYYLKSIGCSCIQFIPRATKNGEETPDLKATLGCVNILCEVKTINPSEEEMFSRKFQSVRQISNQLETGFFNKLKLILEKARDQIIAYDSSTNIKRIVYIIINFDDLLAEYKEHYYQQIDEYLASDPPTEIEIVFHNQQTPFHMQIAMTNACVYNE